MPAYRVREHNNDDLEQTQKTITNKVKKNWNETWYLVQVTQGDRSGCLQHFRRKTYFTREGQIGAARTNQHEGEEGSGGRTAGRGSSTYLLPEGADRRPVHWRLTHVYVLQKRLKILQKPHDKKSPESRRPLRVEASVVTPWQAYRCFVLGA